MINKKKKLDESKKPKAFVHFEVNEDGNAVFKSNASDKELLALMLIIYKNLGEDAQKAFNAVIRTMTFIDKICEV